MKPKSDCHQIVTTYLLLGFVCATGMAGCAWDNLKERGYEMMQKHRPQR